MPLQSVWVCECVAQQLGSQKNLQPIGLTCNLIMGLGSALLRYLSITDGLVGRSGGGGDRAHSLSPRSTSSTAQSNRWYCAGTHSKFNHGYAQCIIDQFRSLGQSIHQSQRERESNSETCRHTELQSVTVAVKIQHRIPNRYTVCTNQTLQRNQAGSVLWQYIYSQSRRFRPLLASLQ